MGCEDNANNSDRHNRHQRLMAYLGVAAFVTGITITLGTVMGGGSSEYDSSTEPIPTSEQPVATPDDGNDIGTLLFFSAVGGLIVVGGKIAIPPIVKGMKEYVNTTEPQAPIPPGADPYTDDRFRQIVEPLRGTMPKQGW
jgi:hypothetical protein